MIDATSPVETDPIRCVEVAIYGLINAGKSSLINALNGEDSRPTSPVGGTTVGVEVAEWASQPTTLGSIRVRWLDTPGLEEIGQEGRDAIATQSAIEADLVVVVVAEDLTDAAFAAIGALHRQGKPIVVALNKIDLLGETELEEVLGAVRVRLEGIVDPTEVVAIAASPIVRERSVVDGFSRVITRRGVPDVEPLRERVLAALDEADDLRDLNIARAESESLAGKRDRERAVRRSKALRVADESAAALALALAINPIPLLDFLTGPGGLAVLVARVSHAYGERPSAEATRAMAVELLKGGRVVLWGAVAGTLAGGAMKLLPLLGHLAGAVTQGASAGFLAHVLGRALVDYLDAGHDWGSGGMISRLEEIASRTDRKLLTKGLVDQIREKLAAVRR